MFNPLTSSNDRVPISANSSQALDLRFGSHVSDALAYTNGGFDELPVRPAGIGELWHPTLNGAHAAVHALENSHGAVVGVGVKFLAPSERSRLLTGDILVDSSWNVLLPGTGSFFVDQTENYWPFLRSVALPAMRAEDKRWQGDFETDLTVGPAPTLEGRMIGASGVLRGHRGEAREALAASGYSLVAQHTAGAVNVRRSLLIVPTSSGASAEHSPSDDVTSH